VSHYHVYYKSGSSLGATVSSPTRKGLLSKMREICLKDVKYVEAVTFEPITKTIEIKEQKGKISTTGTVIKHPFLSGIKTWKRFYNRF